MGGYGWGGFPIPYSYLTEAQATAATTCQAYLTFSITDPVEGALTFYWGDVGFSSSNVSGGAPVYPCVTQWGNLVKYMPSGGRSRDNQAVIRLATTARVSPSNVGGKQFKIYEIFERMNVRDVQVTVYQWNALSTTQEIIWRGYWDSIVGYALEGGPSIEVAMTALPRSSSNAIGEVVSKSVGTYVNAPDESVGLMNVKGYGSMVASMEAATESSTYKLSPFILGYGSRGGPTVAIDQTLPYTKISTKYRGSQNDGTTGVKTTAIGALISGTVGNWYIYDPVIGSYGHVESTDISGTGNDGTSNYIELSNSPTVMFSLKPQIRHSSTSAGLSDISQAINDNASDYVTLTETNAVMAYECPFISLPSGAEVQEIRIVCELYSVSGNSNGVAVGIWDPYTAGGQYWGNNNHFQNFTWSGWIGVGGGSKRVQVITSGTGGAGSWGVWASESANATATLSEFVRGQFMSIDVGANNQRKPLTVRLSWNSIPASGVTYRVYSVALAVKLVYPKVKVGTRIEKTGLGTIPDPFGDRLPMGFPGFGAAIDIIGTPSVTPAGAQVIFNGEYQKDDAGGTYTGTGSALIQKVPDIARHLIEKIGGKTCNVSTGTLGNFIDARTEETAGEKSISPIFGPTNVETLDSALAQITQQYPARIYVEDGVYQCVFDEMNPHQSRIYRSTADTVSIEAYDIIEGTFQVEESGSRSIVNKATVNVGHSYGRNAPLATFTYDNPLSQSYFGASQEQVVDAPWVTVADLTVGAPEAAKYLARYYGRVAARPRLRVKVGLRAKFYDLRPGHVLKFGPSMENASFFCPAYRCGKLDYAFPSTTSANQADSSAPTLVSAGGVDRSPAFGMSMQTNKIKFYVSAAATYSAHASPWQYWNGTALVDLTGATCSDGGSAATLFTRTGNITLTVDAPLFTSWRKGERTYNSLPCGPVYWLQHNCVNVTVAATGNHVTDYPIRWGMIFEVIETNRRLGPDSYPYMETVMQEVM